jgi:hypothetical protein
MFQQCRALLITTALVFCQQVFAHETTSDLSKYVTECDCVRCSREQTHSARQ